ncbi:MAG: winged helix-turn-helix transcriptional regulator [Nitrospirae bacterium]|nr:winged helix-turn-helix transcriptional regulator [Nitrospirota bacterium]
MNKVIERDFEDSYTSLLLLDELSRNGEVTQRDLSKRLGIALGLVNSYIKNLALKGYITISDIPPKRYAYLITPKGFIEKSRLAFQHLHNFNNLYRIARQDFQMLFHSLNRYNVKKLVFCGADELAEIAYITLQEYELELIAVVDTEKKNKNFFNHSIRPLEYLKSIDFDRVLITSFLRGKELRTMLIDIGITDERILLRA